MKKYQGQEVTELLTDNENGLSYVEFTKTTDKAWVNSSELMPAEEGNTDAATELEEKAVEEVVVEHLAEVQPEEKAVEEAVAEPLVEDQMAADTEIKQEGSKSKKKSR